MTRGRRRLRAAALALGAGGCVRAPVPAPAVPAGLPPLTLAGAHAVVDTVARGLVHYGFTDDRGPWAIHVLDADRRACWTPAAVKGAAGAVGRATTSAIATGLARTATVGGGVNADFFLFAPPGLPTGAHVEHGVVVTGPGVRPVFAVDSAGRVRMGALSVTGHVRSRRDTIPVAAWNRPGADGPAWFDRPHGVSLDTATGALRLTIDRRRGGRVTRIDSSGSAMTLPEVGGVLSLGRTAPVALRRRLLALAASGEPVEVDVRLAPVHPRHAVGGFPVLVRDSLEVAGLDSAGSATFGPVRHPRTIAGVAANGRRLLLVTVDGRQTGYSAGMTLRESAQLMRDLGATDAINLDGGGSTTMVVRRDSSGTPRFVVANRPSDPTGERPVGNALALVCNAPAASP